MNFSLQVQRWLSLPVIWIAGLLAGILKNVLPVKIYHQERVWKVLHTPSLLLISNHLTMIDSFYLGTIFFPYYLFHPSFLIWNLPEKGNFFRSFAQAFFFTLLRCVPIHRQGEWGEQVKSLEKIENLLKSGERVLIFPEGTRSRTGKVGETRVGVARIVRRVPDLWILPLSIKGIEKVLPIGCRKPRFWQPVEIFVGHPFRLELEKISPGMRGTREITALIKTSLEEVALEAPQIRAMNE